jgi:hypothetical protein
MEDGNLYRHFLSGVRVDGIFLCRLCTLGSERTLGTFISTYLSSVDIQKQL